MKKIISTLIINLLIFSPLLAQLKSKNAQLYKDNKTYTFQDSTNSTTKAVRSKTRGYIALTFTLGMHPTIKRNGGTASLSYLYSVYDQSTNSSYFKAASFSREFTSQQFLVEIGLLGWEKNLQKRYTELKTGLLTGKHGKALYLSYGMGYRKLVANETIGIRIGASIFYTAKVTNMGQVDNYQKYVIINGKTFDNQFESTFKNTVYLNDATNIDNLLTYNCVGIKPKIGIEFFTPNKGSSIRFNVGYNLPIYQRTSLRLQQEGKNNSGESKRFSISDTYFNYSFSGNNKKNSPYAIDGLFINVEWSCKIITLYKK